MALGLFGIIFFVVYSNVKLVVNVSGSVPFTYFLAVENTFPQKGDYVVFFSKDNDIYSPETLFVKKVMGVEDDVVLHKNNQVFINQYRIGEMLATTKEGKALQPGHQGVIPEGFYFVAGEHPRSFDSRYSAIGLVHEEAILGRAFALF